MATVLKSWDEAKPGATAHIAEQRKAAAGTPQRGRARNVERDNQTEEQVEEVAVEEAETTEEGASEETAAEETNGEDADSGDAVAEESE